MRPPLLLLTAFAVMITAIPAAAQLTWTVRTSGLGDTLHDVAFGIDALTGDRQFVAVGTNNSAPTIATSPDGITWTDSS